MVVSDGSYRAGTPYKFSLLESTCVENDRCGTAAPLAVPYYDESTTEFSSTSTFYNSSVDACSYLSSNVGYNYYQLESGNESTCLEVSLYTRFEGVVAILQGDDCASLSCLAQKTVSASYDDAKVRFVAQPNSTYTIVVGPSYGGNIGSYLFAIEVCFVLVCLLYLNTAILKIPVFPQEAESCSQAVSSSNCSDAITVQSLPTDIAGSVDFAQPFDGYIYGNCGLYWGERVLWYALGPFSGDTCVEVSFSSSSYSSELKFLEGSSCDDLSCRNSIYGGDRLPGRRVLKVPSGETIWMAMTDYRPLVQIMA